MIDIKTLAGKVADEISDAIDYAKMAKECKETDPDLSHTLYDISAQEMEHMDRLHKALAAAVKSAQALYREG